MSGKQYKVLQVLVEYFQEFGKELKAQKEAIGFKELTDDEFKEAIKY